MLHRPHDGSPGTSKKSPRNSKFDAVSAVPVSSVCNLEETSCHIDCATPTNNANMTYNSCVSRPSLDLRQQDEASVSPSCPLPAVPTVAAKMSQSPATRTLANVPLHRRSSDSDLSVTPKGELCLQAKNEINSPVYAEITLRFLYTTIKTIIEVFFFISIFIFIGSIREIIIRICIFNIFIMGFSFPND